MHRCYVENCGPFDVPPGLQSAPAPLSGPFFLGCPPAGTTHSRPGWSTHFCLSSAAHEVGYSFVWLVKSSISDEFPSSRISKGSFATEDGPSPGSLLRIAHRTPDTDMADITVSGGVEDNGPFVLNAPSSLTSCTPVNITWTGGTPPYTLRANFNVLDDDSLKFLPENIADGITTTSFLWNNTVISGFLVSLEVSDGLAVSEITPSPIVVDIPIGSTCSAFVPKLAVSLSSSTSSMVAAPTSSLSTSTSAFSTSSAHTSGTTTVSFPPSLSPTSDSMAWVAPQQHVSLRSGGSIAFIVVGVVVVILLGTFFWWRSRTIRGRRGGRKDAEKQSIADGGDGEEPTELWGSDADWIDGRSSPAAGFSEDHLAAPTVNPFDTPENIVYPVDQIFTASPVSEAGAGPGDRSPPPTRSPAISSPSSTTRTFQVDNSVPGQGAQPLGPKARAIPRLPERTPSVSAHSEGSSARMSTLSDTNAARLSTSTSSTLPPSYRTRRSAGSIYVPTGTDLQNYPAFPPPAYTPAPAPPSAFRAGTRTPTSRRAPRRRVPAPVPGKVHDEVRAASPSATSSTSSASGEREPGAYGGCDEGQVEGSVREEEDADVDLTFLGWGRDGSAPDDLSASEDDMDIPDVVDNVGEAGMAMAVRVGAERTS